MKKENKIKHLFEDWKDIQVRITKTQNLLLFLDYDGTLTPIVSRPELALCPAEVKKVLEGLKDLPGVYIFIVSGRQLKDLKEKIGIEGIFYIGNHGLEIEKPNGVYNKTLSPKRMRESRIIKGNLMNSLSKILGIIFEDKGPILSIHYRNTPKIFLPRIFDIVKEELAKWKNHWKIRYGKMVLEIWPGIDFNKGKVVREILNNFSELESLAIYLGDDQTDEDAFRMLKGKAISVFIGPGKTSSEADFFLQDPGEVKEFLYMCYETRIKEKNCIINI